MNGKPSEKLTQRLLAALDRLPECLALTPVDGQKRPYRPSWQEEPPLTRAELAYIIQHGEKVTYTKKDGSVHTVHKHPQGFGLRTGTISGGIVAVDVDGFAAHAKLLELGSGEPLPDTVSFTSGKPGRCQYALSIPKQYWPHVKTKKIKVIAPDGTEEYLEFRWNFCQSVTPPSNHPETDGYKWVRSPDEVEIAQAPLWLIEQMLIEPEPVEPQTELTAAQHKPSPETQVSLPPKHPDDIQVPVGESVPLLTCCRKEVREWIASGVPKGSGRNDSAIEVALELIAVERYLDSIRQPFSGSARELFSAYCQRSGMTTKEDEERWKWCEAKNPQPSCGADGIAACIRGWYWNQYVKPHRKDLSAIQKYPGKASLSQKPNPLTPPDKSVPENSAQLFALEAIQIHIDELIREGASGSFLTGQLNYLAAKSQYSVIELRKLYFERLEEADFEEDKTDYRLAIENHLKVSETPLDLAKFLPQQLAAPLTLWSRWLAMRPEVVLLALLTGASSLHKVGTELIVHRGQNFRVPPTIYAAIVAESGQKKSPVFNTILRQPLNRLSQEKEDAHKAAVEDYETQLEQWEKTKEGEKPEPPKNPTLYYFTNATGESIPMQSARAPEKALLGLIDELSGLFQSENAYRHGRGSDRQDILSFFDGTGKTVLRADGVRCKIPRIYLSLFGTIQPSILSKLMEDCTDPDGQWARFLFASQPSVPSTLPDDDGSDFDIRDPITSLYRRVDQLPVMEYHLENAAFKRYQSFYNHLERLRVCTSQPGLKAVYSKMEGYVGRFAISLHATWELAVGKKCPSCIIPRWIVEMAIELVLFFIEQAKMLHLSFHDELPAHATKLISLSKELERAGQDGWIKAKVFQNRFSQKKRPTAEQARSVMRETEALGFGTTRGQGCHLEYHWRSDNESAKTQKMVTVEPTSRQKVGGEPTATTSSTQGFQEKVGFVGGFQEPCSFIPQFTSPYTPLPLFVVADVNQEPTKPTFSSNLATASISAVGRAPTFCLPQPTLPTKLTANGEIAAEEETAEASDCLVEETDVAPSQESNSEVMVTQDVSPPQEAQAQSQQNTIDEIVEACKLVINLPAALWDDIEVLLEGLTQAQKDEVTQRLVAWNPRKMNALYRRSERQKYNQSRLAQTNGNERYASHTEGAKPGDRIKTFFRGLFWYGEVIAAGFNGLFTIKWDKPLRGNEESVMPPLKLRIGQFQVTHPAH